MKKVFVVLVSVLMLLSAGTAWGKILGLPETGGSIPYLSDCSGIVSGACLDSDDGKLYVWNGSAVVLAVEAVTDPSFTSVSIGGTTLNSAANLETIISAGAFASDILGYANAAAVLAGIGAPGIAANANISGEWEVQDNIPFKFGNDQDGQWVWSTANTRLELQNSSDTPIFWFDLANRSLGVAAVTAPENSLFDSDAAGAERTDEYAGGVGANMTTTTEDAEVSDVTVYYMKAGTKTAGIEIDGTDGSVSALVKVTVGSGAISQTAQNEYIICTNTCQVTALVAEAGKQLCVRNAPGSATVITLVNRASQYYELTNHSAWATANQKLVSGGVATDSICIVGYDATHYATMNYVGTWTDTAP